MPKSPRKGNAFSIISLLRKERVQKIIENRAKVLPIDPVTLEKLFPFIAVLAIAAIELRTRRPLGLILYRVTKGATDDRAIANPFLALVQYLKKQEQQQKDQRRGGCSPSSAGRSSPLRKPNRHPDSSSQPKGSRDYPEFPLLSAPKAATQVNKFQLLGF